MTAQDKFAAFEEVAPEMNLRPYSFDDATPLPRDFVLPRSWGVWAMDEMGLTRRQVFEQRDLFTDYWWKNEKIKKGRKVRWAITWKMWIKRAAGKDSAQRVANNDGVRSALMAQYGIGR